MALTEEGLLDVPGVASRWVRLANGARAHYMTAGEVGAVSSSFARWSSWVERHRIMAIHDPRFG